MLSFLFAFFYKVYSVPLILCIGKLIENKLSFDFKIVIEIEK